MLSLCAILWPGECWKVAICEKECRAIFVSCSTLHVGCNSRQLEKQSITWCEIGPFRCNAVVRWDRPYFELNKVHCIFELGHFCENSSDFLWITYVELSTNLRKLQYLCTTPESGSHLQRYQIDLKPNHTLKPCTLRETKYGIFKISMLTSRSLCKDLIQELNIGISDEIFCTRKKRHVNIKNALYISSTPTPVC